MIYKTTAKLAAMISAIALLLTACAAPVGPTTTAETRAVRGQWADVGTTVAALGAGASEANPLGVALLPVKYWLHGYIKSQPAETQARLWPLFGAAGWFGAGNNVCVVLGIVSGGIGSAAICPLAGLLTAFWMWERAPEPQGGGDQ